MTRRPDRGRALVAAAPLCHAAAMRWCEVGAVLAFGAMAVAQEPAAAPAPAIAAAAADDDRYVEIVDLELPPDCVLEVGGLAVRGDDLFVATRRGEIWRIADAHGAAPQFSLWAEGLQEPLGLLDRDGWLYCSQRGELSRLRDADGDGRMDELQTVAQGWPLSGNYHEYCFGPAVAADGRLWLTLNKPFGDEPFGKAAFRGWAISIGADGRWVGECAGLRSPCGIAAAPWGEIFYTDNQGEWCPTNKLAVLERGDFHGHPWGIDSCTMAASKVAYPGDVAKLAQDGLRLDTAARTIPGFRLPAVWMPYDELGRSAAGFVWDATGHFAPYRGQVFCGDQYSAEVFRISLETVQGRWQGACYPFRRGLRSGITRLCWGNDGSLWCGETNRGWGSKGDSEYGLQRLRWRGAQPFDLVEVTALANGFRLRFSAPVAATGALPDAFAVASWTYDLHEGYGCDPRDRRVHAVTAVGIGADGTTVDLGFGPDPLPLCRVYAIDCRNVLDAAAQTPWHGRAWYTRNAAP